MKSKTNSETTTNFLNEQGKASEEKIEVSEYSIFSMSLMSKWSYYIVFCKTVHFLLVALKSSAGNFEMLKFDRKKTE